MRNLRLDDSYLGLRAQPRRIRRRFPSAVSDAPPAVLDFERRRAIGLLAVLPWLPIGLAACGGAAALIVPFITYAFEGVITTGGVQDVVQVNLGTSSQPGQATGNLSGVVVNLRDKNGNSIPLQVSGTGSYSGSSVNLSLPAAVAPLDTSYSGTFAEADLIVLVPANSALPMLTLVRADPSFKPSLDASTFKGKDASSRDWTMNFQTDPAGLDDSTVYLTGTDMLTGQPDGTITGYAAMRHLEITLTRGATKTAFSARLGPAGTTPPPTTGNPLRALTITFGDGTVLTRTSP